MSQGLLMTNPTLLTRLPALRRPITLHHRINNRLLVSQLTEPPTMIDHLLHTRPRSNQPTMNNIILITDTARSRQLITMRTSVARPIRSLSHLLAPNKPATTIQRPHSKSLSKRPTTHTRKYILTLITDNVLNPRTLMRQS